MADSKKYNGSTWEHSLHKLTTATEIVENPLYSDGTAITAYTIKGSTVQNGTPTPSSPVEVNGVGERTAQKFDKSNATISYTTLYSANEWLYSGQSTAQVLRFAAEPNTQYTLSFDSNINNTIFRLVSSATDTVPSTSTLTVAVTDITKSGNIKQYSFTTPNNTKWLCLQVDYNVMQDVVDSLMLNTGSIAKPFEPYGYKTPLLSGQQTIDIYIGDLPLLKSLDGTAVDEISNGTLTRRVDSDGSVLPTPTITQITMPSIPTTEGANSITVDTTVQPSEFTATWTGWHDSSTKEWDGSQWN